MPSPRFVCWSLGAVAGLGLAAMVPEDEFPGARPALFGSALLTLGVCGEWLDARSRRGAAERAVLRRDTRPADRRIDIAPLANLERVPNPFDPRFGQFQVEANPPEFIGNGPGKSEGICPPLLGRIVLASLFLGRNGRGWAERELADGHVSILLAAQWLEREAVRYGAGVNLEVAAVYFVADDDEEDEVALGFITQGEETGPLEENATTKALHRASRAARQLGFQDAPALFGIVEQETKADVVAWMLHPREASRSFAIPLDQGALGGVSLAVCYPREASFPEPLVGPVSVDPVTVVHELLHLFGATDKYGRALSAFPAGAVTRRDVMRLSEERLSSLRVDPATASEIGWVGAA